MRSVVFFPRKEHRGNLEKGNVLRLSDVNRFGFGDLSIASEDY